MKAMAVTNFDPAADPEVFDGWICDVRSAAEAARGFVAFATSISRYAPLDWAVAVTFESEDFCTSGSTGRHGSTWCAALRREDFCGSLRIW